MDSQAFRSFNKWIHCSLDWKKTTEGWPKRLLLSRKTTKWWRTLSKTKRWLFINKVELSRDSSPSSRILLNKTQVNKIRNLRKRLWQNSTDWVNITNLPYKKVHKTCPGVHKICPGALKTWWLQQTSMIISLAIKIVLKTLGHSMQ